MNFDVILLLNLFGVGIHMTISTDLVSVGLMHYKSSSFSLDSVL